MKFFKKFKNVDDFVNHQVNKNYFSMVEGMDNILLSSQDNTLTTVENGKLKLDTTNKVVQSYEMEGSFNSPDSDLYLLDSKIKGQKTSGNAKVITDDTKIIINNFYVESDAENGIYNVFEQPQNPKEITEYYLATNIIVDGLNLKHNVFNIYNLKDNAEIIIKDCKFDINMATTNVMRLANYKNAENVSVTFENVEWTYENVGYESSDIDWAGLVLYQPASTDVALNGDLSILETWTFKFKNCTYNGEKVTDINTGMPGQVMYLYNIGKTGKNIPPISLNIIFQ